MIYLSPTTADSFSSIWSFLCFLYRTSSLNCSEDLHIARSPTYDYTPRRPLCSLPVQSIHKDTKNVSKHVLVPGAVEQCKKKRRLSTRRATLTSSVQLRLFSRCYTGTRTRRARRARATTQMMWKAERKRNTVR